MHPQTLSPKSLIEEIEERLKAGGESERALVLRRVTELFLDRASNIVEEQVAFFGEVFERLIEEIESRSLITLSEQLAPVKNAPANIIRRLARHDEIDVSRPVLEQSERLADEDLIEIAESKSQAHLSAIAGRRVVNPAVTDVLVCRGEPHVTNKVAANPGAGFSKAGFTALVLRAQRDGSLAIKLAQRPELTPELLKLLVSRAAETVRERLLAQADPALRDKITAIIPAVAERVERRAVMSLPNQPTRGASTLIKLDRERIRADISDFAAVGRLQEMIDAFAMLTELPAVTVRRLLQRTECDATLILSKAAGLSWPTAKSVLAARAELQLNAESSSQGGFDQYFRLSTDTAQRVLRYLKARMSLTEKEIEELIDRSRGVREKSAAAPGG